MALETMWLLVQTWNRIKKQLYFSFDFGWYSIHFDIARLRKGGVEGLLTDKIC